MQITSFNPIIVTKDGDAVISLFEELGFSRRHTKAGIDIEEHDHTVARLKNEGGFDLDITQTDRFERDLTGIRVNVDDFDAAMDLLVSRGFTHLEEGVFETASSKFALMRSPSGLFVNLCHHVRKND